MSFGSIIGNALRGAASALSSATQTQQSPASQASTNNGTPTQQQAAEALQRVAQRQAKPTLFEEQISQLDPRIVARRNIYDRPVTVPLPKPAAQMTKVDYDMAFARAMLKRAGLPESSDVEVGKFMYEYARVTEGHFGFLGGEPELRAWQGHHQEIRATSSEYGLAVADAGKRQIHADRAAIRAQEDRLRREAQAYGEEALTGFYKLQANGVVEVVNDATKIVGLPELPKFEVTGEYWADKKQVGEAATSIGAAVVTGGASLPGDLLLMGSATGNLTEAATGEDMRTGEQLTTGDRVLRGASGAVGGYAVRGRVGQLTDDVAARMNNVMKPPTSTTEAVTAEGVRMRVPVKEEPLISPHQKITSVDSSGRASGLRFRDDYIEHISKRDFSVPRRDGIGGAHNLQEFNKYLHEVNVVSRAPHPTLRGVEKIEYQIPVLDRAGKPTGNWRPNPPFRKTLYDPAVISDKQMMEWGRQAFAEAQVAGRINLAKREWTGYAPNGIKFFGHIDAQTNAVRTFFPEF